ncbi:hypothetical protein M427DRAFT_57653 [Gonapodya prolifera JEL478]|uniref:F-box domain-containing protein n=1 Tax=Gonapodya prolifera (strain JEL478) TaxID=1344416 RepID=A0A139ADG5_GONPJ|nr:hypothetical protein M427DRAFT_57653 [Gonapodya prolifera JEL478]|eukprot:KXS14485.1 hypothetical protein M427DRAFT_57653 [Gonapodya prolifera JEL478]
MDHCLAIDTLPAEVLSRIIRFLPPSTVYCRILRLSRRFSATVSSIPFIGDTPVVECSVTLDCCSIHGRTEFKKSPDRWLPVLDTSGTGQTLWAVARMDLSFWLSDIIGEGSDEWTVEQVVKGRLDIFRDGYAASYPQWAPSRHRVVITQVRIYGMRSLESVQTEDNVRRGVNYFMTWVSNRQIPSVHISEDGFSRILEGNVYPSVTQFDGSAFLETSGVPPKTSPYYMNIERSPCLFLLFLFELEKIVTTSRNREAGKFFAALKRIAKCHGFHLVASDCIVERERRRIKEGLGQSGL